MTRKKSAAKPLTQRQQRVAEEIRHILSEILQRHSIWCADLHRFTITVCEVKVSPDLRHAFVYVMPLGGTEPEESMKALAAGAPALRKFLAQKMHLRTVPELHFHMDTLFEHVDRIERLLNQSRVRQDVESDV